MQKKKKGHVIIMQMEKKKQREEKFTLVHDSNILIIQKEQNVWLGSVLHNRNISSLLWCFLGSRGLPVTVIQTAPLPTEDLALRLIWAYSGSEWLFSLTFFSGGSLQPDSLILCRSWNFTRTSSMANCSRSQKAARSWVVGWGYAVGSWGVV